MTSGPLDPALVAELGRMMRATAALKHRAADLERHLTLRRRHDEAVLPVLERFRLGEEDVDAARQAGGRELPLRAVRPRPAPRPAPSEEGLMPRPGFACLSLDADSVPARGIVLPGLGNADLIVTLHAVIRRQVATRGFVPVIVTDAGDVGPIRRRGLSYAWIPPTPPDADPASAAADWQRRLDRLNPAWRLAALDIAETAIGARLADAMTAPARTGPV